MFSLYPYQKNAVAAVSRAILEEKFRRPLVVLPTGGGKTVLAAAMLKTAVDAGHKGLFVVHRQELLEQAQETIQKTGVRCVRIAAGSHPSAMDADAPMKVATVQTLVARLRRKKTMFTLRNKRAWSPSFVWWDEAHHCAADTWEKVAEYYRSLRPNLVEVGLTATPRRNDGKPLGNFFDVLIEGPDIRALINEGRLSDYVLYAPETPLHAFRAIMKTRMGDFAQKEQAEKVQENVRQLASNAVNVYAEHCAGQQAIFFGASIAHSQSVAARFNAAGFLAQHVDGKMDMRERRRIISSFRSGETTVLCNYALISEGFDVPECSVVIFGRATQSLTVWLQACGRALRARPGKVATIIDQGWNWESLGKPDDPRRWSLTEIVNDGYGAEDRDKTDTRKRCKKCGFVGDPVPKQDGGFECEKCGAEFENVGVKIEELEAMRMVAVGGRLNGQAVPRGHQMTLPLRRRKASKSPSKHPVSRRVSISEMVSRSKAGEDTPVNPKWARQLDDMD